MPRVFMSPNAAKNGGPLNMNTSASPESGGVRLPYISALDGLRALAVVAVMLYHADIGWLPGGFLGVDIFFVISGYLITSLLLAEYRSKGSIDLVGFWFRRARRLLPAVFLMIAATLTFAVLFLPQEVAGLRSAALAAVGYVMNWYLIFAHQSYFQAIGRPSLLKHLWSLAVEEQFYLFWPIVLVFGLALFRRGGVLVLALAGAVASTLLMVHLYDPNVDPSRVYYGTDTRATGLLLGAALAFVWTPGSGFNRPNRGKRYARGTLYRRFGWMRPAMLNLLGLGSLGALVWFCASTGEYDPFLYQGGFALVALSAAALIAVVVHPRTHFGFLGFGPLRWVGVRSYGIYLWHWPIFMLTRPDLDVPLHNGPLLLALRFGLTLFIADLSYRFVETPIRRGALGRSLRKLRQSRGRRRKWLGLQWSAATVACVAFIAVLGANMVYAKAPDRPSFLPKNAIHAKVLGTKAKADSSGNSNNPAQPSQQASRPDSKLAAENTNQKNEAKAVDPAPPGLVTAIGDSVMLGAAPQLEKRIPNFQVTDATVGLQVEDAIAILKERKAAGQLGNTEVVALGTNGTFTPEEFDEIMHILKNTRRVVFVNDKVDRPWEASNNEVILQGTERYKKATLVDWYDASVNHPEYFYPDGIHTNPTGAKAYANLIAKNLGR